MKALQYTQNFDKNQYTELQWVIAIHEAAHFFAAIYYRFYIQSVRLWKRPSRYGSLGEVHIDRKPTLSNIIITAAGPSADLRMLPKEKLESDAGFIRELNEVIRDTKIALQDDYHDLYLGSGEPNKEQIRAALRVIASETDTLVKDNWESIETIAKAFLMCRSKSTGKIARTKLKNIKQMARELLK